MRLRWERNRMRSFFLFLFTASLASFGQQTNVLVEAGILHLGEKQVAKFPEANRKPSGPKLERTFESQSNPTEWTLRLSQENVTDDWPIQINNQPIGRLNIRAGQHISYFKIPPGALVEGTNTLAIIPSNRADDVLVGQVEVIPERMRDLLKLGHVVINVTEPNGRAPVPARVTIASADGKLAELYNFTPVTAAWRKGIFYTGGLPVELDLPQGDWVVSATRGVEWSRPQVKLRVFVGQNNRMTLPIAHDIDTTGFIAVDTHLHTYTFSGHGDANVDERIITLAGEGVELAIATDHNHFTDYKPRQAALGASQFFTSVIGNEVTTANGHVNGFPFTVDSIKPNFKETNWVKLVADIRERGAQYVILNHPRWPALTNNPFLKWGVNRAEGSRTNAMALTMDAMEVVNSTVPLKDPNYLLRDWFALWNRGEHLWAVGASDTHTVADPPGQGRTYVASSSDDPASIDVDAAIKQMQAGNMSVSYGLFGTVTVNGAAHMGQLAKPVDGAINVVFHVASPNWITARKAIVYLNGLKVAEQELVMVPRTTLSTNVTFKIPAPPHDAHLVCVAYGDGVKDPSWKTLHDYTLAVTNPVFIDVDGDGKFSSAHDTAVAQLKKLEPLSVAKIESAIAGVDDAVGVQMMAQAKLQLPAKELEHWNRLLDKLASQHELYQFYRSPLAAQ
jgi:hypothetical protein